jgi:hypothetical protein
MNLVDKLGTVLEKDVPILAARYIIWTSKGIETLQ